jgi:hypothetical protein
MSKNWGRTPVTNADKHRLTQSKYFVETNDGPEERIDRRPQGKVEKFVDPVGNVCSLQIHGEGDSQRAQTEIRLRAAYHKKGFVEFSKCPIRHGTRHANAATGREFAKMPASLEGECKKDPKIMERKDGELYARPGCAHIEWLITFRREQEAAQLAKRNAGRIAQEKRLAEKQELEQIQLEMAREQVKEFKAKKAAKPKATVE